MTHALKRHRPLGDLGAIPRPSPSLTFTFSEVDSLLYVPISLGNEVTAVIASSYITIVFLHLSEALFLCSSHE